VKEKGAGANPAPLRSGLIVLLRFAESSFSVLVGALALLFLDAAVLRFRDFAMEGVDIFRLRWFAASDLTLARPKAPQIAGRAL
jgi:hypothetical protein